ncbi:MAG: hypothetical protein AAF843_02015 [Bacteroidota bacterium]
MKQVLITAIIISAFTFSACDGPVGPQGPPGLDGADGQPGEIGFVMQWEGKDFTSSNDYQIFLDFGEFEFTALDSDVALVYLLWDVDENSGDQIWRQLQQTLIVEEGILQYNFDFTRFDANIFMDADFDLGILGERDTDNWTIRVVVVPSDFVGGRKSHSEVSYQELEARLGLPDLKLNYGSLPERR